MIQILCIPDLPVSMSMFPKLLGDVYPVAVTINNESKEKFPPAGIDFNSVEILSPVRTSLVARLAYAFHDAASGDRGNGKQYLNLINILYLFTNHNVFKGLAM